LFGFHFLQLACWGEQNCPTFISAFQERAGRHFNIYIQTSKRIEGERATVRPKARGMAQTVFLPSLAGRKWSSRRDLNCMPLAHTDRTACPMAETTVLNCEFF
jgi:hypothetical protein